MSNNQWNPNPTEENRQSQSSASEAAPGAYSQPSAQEWNNTGAQDWSAAPAPQPQASAPEWNNTGAQDWSGAPAGAPAGTPEWNNTGAQNWNQAGAGQQQWNPGQPAAGYGAPMQQQWQGQPAAGNAFGNVFDFSLKKFALPSAGGTIFLVSAICLGVWWLFDLINAFTSGSEYLNPTRTILSALFAGTARTVLWLLMVRVFIEGMTALVKFTNRDQ